MQESQNDLLEQFAGFPIAYEKVAGKVKMAIKYLQLPAPS